MERKKKITNYTVLMDNKLGEGAFGKVYVGEQDNTNLKVAIKVLEKKAGNNMFI
jgi:serine/threonine protein kinase